jgi:hypothetical protein
MHEIKAKLMDELYEIEEKMKKAGGGKVSMPDLDHVHKLTDTIKNIDKIEALEMGGYSEATDFMGEGRMYGTSYARRNRDSMGRYSRDGGMSYEGGSSYDDGRGGMTAIPGYSRDGAKADMINKAEDMMRMAGNERERQAIREFIKKLEHG